MSARSRGVTAKPLGTIRRGRRSWAFVAAAGPGFMHVLTEAGEVITVATEWESDQLVERLGVNHVLFAVEWRSVLRAGDPTRWTFRQRRSRVIDARHVSGARLVKLPPGIMPRDPGEGMVAFARYMMWLGERDVWPTSRSGWATMGRHLWLATLPAPVQFDGGRVERHGLFGGRKDAPFPSRYRRVSHYDISGAYPSALNAPTPQRLRPARDPRAVWDPERIGIACARVFVPEHLSYWPPLPTLSGPTSSNWLRWATGTIAGWWTFEELRGAIAVGCSVEVLEAWIGRETVAPFAAWFGEIEIGRALAGAAGGLAKSHANSLWSSFAVGPATVFVRRFVDRLAQRSEVVERRPGVDFAKGTAYVAALTAARVRTRLYDEALAPGGVCDDLVIYVDTDGIMAPPGRRFPGAEMSSGLGSWRHDRSMRTVDIRCPGAYRWTCEHCGDDHPAWHYSVAGANSHEAAERRFDHFPRQDNYDQAIEEVPI